MLRVSRYLICSTLFSSARSFASSLASSFPSLSTNGGTESVQDKPNRNVRPAHKWKELREEQRYRHGRWRPKKRLSWYQIEHLKTLHQELPQENSIEQLADKFGISYHAVRRILRSRFEPSADVQERQDRQAMRQKQERQSKWRTSEGKRKQKC